VISLAEIRYSIAGALRLARGDAGGLEHFDNSIERFWRSFWAAAICAPMYFVILFSVERPTPIKDWTYTVLSTGLTYIILWALWPLAMIYLSQWMDRAGHYFRYVQAINWAQVVGTALQLLVVLLAQGAGNQGLAVMLIFAWGAVLVYEWYVSRLALEVTNLQAVGVVAFNLVLTYVVSSGVAALGRS